MNIGPLSAPTGTPGKTLRSIGRTLDWHGAREVVIWLLLLGSWQFLAASGSRNGIIGAVGTVMFLVFAVANLDRLEGLGLEHARRRSVASRTWVLAATTGFMAGLMVFWIATASGEGIKLSDDRKLMLLQVTLGPILEEVVFRGYLFALVLWGLAKIRSSRWDWFVVAIVAMVFSAVHLAQPGVSWVQVACISCTGALYGLVRYASGSAAPAAASHAAYNLTLYAVSSVLKLLGKGWQ
jgi:membrane protease YdiL (CAAX protease family)